MESQLRALLDCMEALQLVKNCGARVTHVDLGARGGRGTKLLFKESVRLGGKGWTREGERSLLSFIATEQENGLNIHR